MTVWSRHIAALARRTVDGVVVLGPLATAPRFVDDPAASVWDLLAAPAREDELVETLAERFGAERSEVARDVAAVLAAWEADGAVEREPER